MATRTFDAGEIVRVPFPYTDRSTRQRRPALVISAADVGRDASLIWVLMITSAENAGWPGDVAIRDQSGGTGLPIASVVRSEKIATIGADDAEPIGRVAASTLAAVRTTVGRILSLDPCAGRR